MLLCTCVKTAGFPCSNISSSSSFVVVLPAAKIELRCVHWLYSFDYLFLIVSVFLICIFLCSLFEFYCILSLPRKKLYERIERKLYNVEFSIIYWAIFNHCYTSTNFLLRVLCWVFLIRSSALALLINSSWSIPVSITKTKIFL